MVMFLNYFHQERKISMTMDEVIALANKQCSGDKAAMAILMGAKLIADAVDRVAIQDGRMADLQDQQWEKECGLMDQIAPGVEASKDIINKLKEQLEEGEEWKTRTDDDDDV
jgi:hypothetical protein